MKYVGPILYRTLGTTLPPGMAMASVIWGLSFMYVQSYPLPARRAGFGGPSLLAANRLFRKILNSPSGVIYARSNLEESWGAIRRGGNRINLLIPEMLEELLRIQQEGPVRDEDFPFILSAGERRSETTNTVIRDASWHQKGIYASLRLSPQDATEIGCDSGETLRLTTRRASVDVIAEISDMMTPGHISLPNGAGIDYIDSSGDNQRRGVAPNELTDASSRDFLAGTPWHKHVPARLEKPACVGWVRVKTKSG
jgi:hypothetical protein